MNYIIWVADDNPLCAATNIELQQFKDALAYVNTLGDLAQEQFQNSYDTYIANAKKNINTWAGDGIVLKSSS